MVSPVLPDYTVQFGFIWLTLEALGTGLLAVGEGKVRAFNTLDEYLQYKSITHPSNTK
jgi:hypothetical protein